MARVDLFMPMAMSTMARGLMIRHMEGVSIAISTEPSTKEIGSRTSSTGMDLRHGPMELGTRVNTFWARSMVSVNSLGLTVAHIMALSKRTIFRVTASTTGPTAEYSRAHGTTIKWRVKDSSLGPTAEDTRATTRMTKRRVKASSSGLMAESMKEGGKMVNSME